jgi:RNA polymerase sigma-70 factor (ECF subfamily)
LSPPTAEDDGALAARAATGEERAFTLLMRRHKEAVWRLARRYTGDADEALDLTQETFAAAWSAMPGFDPARPFGPWIRRVALNKCRDWSRKRAVRRFLSGRLDEPARLAAEDPAPDPERTAAGRQALGRLDRAVAALPDGLKAPLILTALEGLSLEAAGAVLGLSAKAVEVRAYRARKKLSEILGPDPEG